MYYSHPAVMLKIDNTLNFTFDKGKMENFKVEMLALRRMET